MGDQEINPTKDLSMGDLVEVWEYRKSICKYIWKKAIFIKPGHSGGVVCVEPASSDDFYSDKGFFTQWYSPENWRRLGCIKFRPFKWEERVSLRGVWVIKLSDRSESLIHSLLREPFDVPDRKFLIEVEGTIVSAESLLKDYIFLDGSPCGIQDRV